MGATASQDQDPPATNRPPPRPSMGVRPNNLALPPSFHPAHMPEPTSATIRPVEYRSPVQKSAVVPNVLSLNRASLVLVPAHDPRVLLVQFQFSATVAGYVTIFYAAQERVHRAGPTLQHPITRVTYVSAGDRPGRTKFAAGNDQLYRQNPEKALDLRRFTSADLRCRDGTYPLVIRLEACYETSQTPVEHRVRSHTTFAEISQADHVYNVHVVAQHVFVDGIIYRVQDIYGIGATHESTTHPSEHAQSLEDARECLICMTEPCNTVAQPCNHLCLCDECARVLGSRTEYQARKCPVCRTPLISFLRIITAPSASTNPHSDTETGSTQPETRHIPAHETQPQPSHVTPHSKQNDATADSAHTRDTQQTAEHDQLTPTSEGASSALSSAHTSLHIDDDSNEGSSTAPLNRDIR